MADRFRQYASRVSKAAKEGRSLKPSRPSRSSKTSGDDSKQKKSPEGLSKSAFDTIVKVAEAEAAGKSTEGLVDHLKKTRSVENIRNKQAAYDEVLRRSEQMGNKGMVARTTDGSIITDSSGNPILMGRGKEVFDETRGEFRTGSEALRQASPELYQQMYPMSSFGMTGLPSLLPGVGTLTRLMRGAGGQGREIMGQVGKTLRPVVGGLNKIPGAIGNIFNKWNFGLPGSNRVSTAIPAGDGGGGGIDRGIVDAAQSVVDQQSPYGGWIGRDESKMYTADFIDNDGDGIDDRWQTGPGMPSQNPFQGNKMADEWNKSFQVGNMPPHLMPPMMDYSPMTTDIAASQAAGYDIPIGGQPTNMENWYKNLGIINLANKSFKHGGIMSLHKGENPHLDRLEKVPLTDDMKDQMYDWILQQIWRQKEREKMEEDMRMPYVAPDATLEA